MAKPKLTYFDLHGGRGEPARLAMFIGGVDFEDDRVSFADFRERKSGYPCGAVPVLKVDGESVCQSNGINAYVGKLAGLYPSDPWQAAKCDEAMGAVEDISHKVIATFSIKDEEDKRKAREALCDGAIKFFLERINAMLERSGGQHFAGGELSVADLKVFVWIRNIKSGNLDHIPADIADKHAPLLVALHDRLAADERIKSYYAQFE